MSSQHISPSKGVTSASEHNFVLNLLEASVVESIRPNDSSGVQRLSPPIHRTSVVKNDACLNLWDASVVTSIRPRDASGGKRLPPPTYRTSESKVVEWYELSKEDQNLHCTDWHAMSNIEKKRAHKSIQGDRCHIVQGVKKIRRIQVWRDRSRPKGSPASFGIKSKSNQNEMDHSHQESYDDGPLSVTMESNHFIVPQAKNDLEISPPSEVQSPKSVEGARMQQQAALEMGNQLNDASHLEQEVAEGLMDLKNIDVHAAMDKCKSEVTKTNNSFNAISTTRSHHITAIHSRSSVKSSQIISVSKRNPSPPKDDACLNLWDSSAVESIRPSDASGGKRLPPPTYRTSESKVAEWYELSKEDQNLHCTEWHVKSNIEKKRAHKSIQGDRCLIVQGVKKIRRIQVWRDRSRPKGSPASLGNISKSNQDEKDNMHQESRKDGLLTMTVHTMESNHSILSCADNKVEIPPLTQVQSPKLVDATGLHQQTALQTGNQLNVVSRPQMARRGVDNFITSHSIQCPFQENNAAYALTQLPPPLSTEENTIVLNCVHGSGLEDEKISTCNGCTVFLSSMRTLSDTSWLNDEIISYFFLMLSKRDELLFDKGFRRKRSWFCGPFFVSKMLPTCKETGRRLYNFENVKRWQSKLCPGGDVFDLDKILVPCNVNGVHWSCMVAFMTEKRIQYFDSIGGNGNIFTEGLLSYLKDVWQLKHECDFPNGDAWEIIGYRDGEVPQQHNSYDCGVYACMFADLLSTDRLHHSFGQHDATLYRKRIALSIIKSIPVPDPRIDVIFPTYATKPEDSNAESSDDEIECWGS